jgi:hypothetical protein
LQSRQDLKNLPAAQVDVVQRAIKAPRWAFSRTSSTLAKGPITSQPKSSKIRSHSSAMSPSSSATRIRWPLSTRLSRGRFLNILRLPCCIGAAARLHRHPHVVVFPDFPTEYNRVRDKKFRCFGK